ncbi:hypothetical protein ACFQL7_28015 [Halocatena marina]|uniref:Halobacterial output domain-containing protein n=1 Tax=Halocatena marina TaxID=2934937 RepID=A0ABD5YXU4_9EURY
MSTETSSDPLPASVSEYTIDYPGATPTRIMRELDLDSAYRAQVEYFCTVTRYTLYAEMNDCEKGVDLRLQTVEWADVAEWEVPAEDRPPEA